MNNKDQVVLKKIVGYCNDIETLLNRYDRSFEKYKADIAFQYSINMCIIQIGELVTRLSDEVKQKNAQIPWNEIRAMRNLHAHDYENVDFSIVWHTVVQDIPELKDQILSIYSE